MNELFIQNKELLWLLFNTNILICGCFFIAYYLEFNLGKKGHSEVYLALKKNMNNKELFTMLFLFISLQSIFGINYVLKSDTFTKAIYLDEVLPPAYLLTVSYLAFVLSKKNKKLREFDRKNHVENPECIDQERLFKIY